MTEERYSGEYPDGLFDWQRVLFVAAGRGLLSAREVGIAGFIALSGDGTSGENCRIHEDRLVAETGASRATVNRGIKKLRDGGWFEQTRKPSFRGKGQGLKALYRVSWPRLDVRHDSLSESRLTATPDDATRLAADDRVVSQIEPSRVSNPAESCLTVTPDREPMPTSYGPTSYEPTCPTPEVDDVTSVRATPGDGDLDDFAEGPIEQHFDSLEHDFVASSYSDRFCACGNYWGTHWQRAPWPADDDSDTDLLGHPRPSTPGDLDLPNSGDLPTPLEVARIAAREAAAAARKAGTR